MHKPYLRFQLFTLKSFANRPFPMFRRLCETLRCSFSEEFVTAFSRFVNCTGDNNVAVKSRRGKLGTNSAAGEDDRQAPAWQAAARDDRCQEADRLLGYVA